MFKKKKKIKITKKKKCFNLFPESANCFLVLFTRKCMMRTYSDSFSTTLDESSMIVY